MSAVPAWTPLVLADVPQSFWNGNRLPKGVEPSSDRRSEQPYVPQGSVLQRTLQSWLDQRELMAQHKLRIPAVLAAQRIGIADRRCRDLYEQIDFTRDAILNRPHTASQADVRTLEERLLKLQEQLGTEHLVLWRDLGSLLVQARDAAVEEARSAWLRQFTAMTKRPGDEQ